MQPLPWLVFPLVLASLPLHGEIPKIQPDGAPPVIIDPKAAVEDLSLYPSEEKLNASPGDTTYYVNPSLGDDNQPGTDRAKPWKSIARVNAMRFAPGDRIFIAPGLHQETLKPSGAGTAEKPVTIHFAPGRHEFGVEKALRRAWFVSNSCDDPTLPRPVGILLANVRHFKLAGGGKAGPQKTDVVFGGRMIEMVNDHAEGITVSGLAFDLKRPTVSEFRVLEAKVNEVTIQIAEGSTYAIENGRFAWTGDLGPGWAMAQQATLADGRSWRMGQWNPFATARAVDLGGGKVRLVYEKGNFGMVVGRQFQFRNVTRDTVSAHNNRCRDIVFRDCAFHALTGMGFVSQFSENITFDHVDVISPEGTLRTCPAWADAFHFSGCRGKILVDTCRFAGLQDDPINVHGTHLRIIEKPAPNQLRLRFMQPQTYGFAAFQPGDDVAVISHSNLRELPDNPRRKVAALVRDPADNSGKTWLLTLDGPAPVFGPNDVIDNLSWYPDVTVRNCHVSMSSCRGFLLTTRGKVLVEGCTFQRTAMAAILIEDDAEGWFESGPIRDMILRDNHFIGCGIEINPMTRSNNPEEPVHENIRIENNFFEGGGISAKSTRNLTVIRNRFTAATLPVTTQPSCSKVTLEANTTGATQ